MKGRSYLLNGEEYRTLYPEGTFIAHSGNQAK
jgi:hypothetical protein